MSKGGGRARPEPKPPLADLSLFEALEFLQLPQLQEGNGPAPLPTVGP
jgi:hypothetical protein